MSTDTTSDERTRTLNELDAELQSLSYPASLAAVRDELGDVTLQYADGSEPLTDVLDRVQETGFDSPDDLLTELFNHLPVEAVGEPGQAEGEG